MLLKISESGSGVCRANVIVPQGAKGVQLMSINLPLDCAEFSPAFVAGITDVSTAEEYNIPACASLGALVDFINTFEIGGVRMLAAYRTFADNWEIWNEAGGKTITFSDEFASYFRFDYFPTLEEGDGVDTQNHNLDPVVEYIVEVSAPIKGVFTDDFTDAIGFVDTPSGKPQDDYFFEFDEPCHRMSVVVKYRLKDGTIRFATCPEGERWSVTLKLV